MDPLSNQKKPEKCDSQILKDLVQTCFLGVLFVILFAFNSAWYFWSVIVFVVYCIRCNSLSSAVLKEAFAYAAVAGATFWILSVLSQWWELYAAWLFVGIALSFFVRASSDGIVPWGKTVQDQMGRFFGNIEAKIVDHLHGLLSHVFEGGASESSKVDRPTSKASAPSRKKRQTSSKSETIPSKKKKRESQPSEKS